MKKILLGLTLLPQFFCLIAQPLAISSPESVGMSSSYLSHADELITSTISKGELPGGVFVVVRKGKIVYFKHYGFRTNDHKVKYQNDDIFRIASMTKAVTTVAIMQLYERGKLGLDDPVYWYLPKFKEAKVLDSFNEEDSSYTTVPVKRPITIRHLLTHTSGITYGEFNPGKLLAVYTKLGMTGVGLSHPTWTTEEFIDKLAGVPLAFQPGEQFLYGLNMDVLGRIIEVVSGMTLDEYFRQHIFMPLGMTDTYFYVPKNKQDRIVQVYTEDENKKEIMSSSSGLNNDLDYPKMIGRNHFAGGGGLSSTAMDYARLIQALLNNGLYNGYHLLRPQTMDVLTGDQLIKQNREGKGISTEPGISFCLGFLLWTQEAQGLAIKSPGTYEWGGYFNTKFFIDPEEELIFVGMTQIVPYSHGEFWDRLYAIIYGAIEE